MIDTNQLMESAQPTVMAVLPVFVTVTLPGLFGDPTVAVKASVDGEMLNLVAVCANTLVTESPPSSASSPSNAKTTLFQTSH